MKNLKRSIVISIVCTKQIETFTDAQQYELLKISGESFFGKRKILKRDHKISLIRRGFANTFLSKYERAYDYLEGIMVVPAIEEQFTRRVLVEKTNY